MCAACMKYLGHEGAHGQLTTRQVSGDAIHEQILPPLPAHHIYVRELVGGNLLQHPSEETIHPLHHLRGIDMKIQSAAMDVHLGHSIH